MFDFEKVHLGFVVVLELNTGTRVDLFCGEEPVELFTRQPLSVRERERARQSAAERRAPRSGLTLKRKGVFR